ncbi:MAG: nucleotidyltransferase family protein [Pseudomonadota bacterium]
MSDALILAAGRGARLRPVTDTCPKPLLRVGGFSLLERHLTGLAAAGVRRAVVNLGWLGQEIVRSIGDGSRLGLQVVYSVEGYPTLDTGGAIVRALPLLESDSFWVINADIWTEFQVSTETDALLADADAAIGLVPNPDYRSTGDFDIGPGRYVSNRAEPGMTFSGIAVYRRAFFSSLPDGRYSVVPLLRQAADANALRGFDLGARWFDIGTPQRLAAVRAEVSESRIRED